MGLDWCLGRRTVEVLPSAGSPEKANWLWCPLWPVGLSAGGQQATAVERGVMDDAEEERRMERFLQLSRRAFKERWKA